MKLTQLLERLEYEVVQGDDQIEVTELINDSRKVTEGSVFVCISGAVSDGHAYVQQVAEKGAAAVIVEKDVEAPEGLTVIKVENTRYALALTSAAYFGYPAEKLKVIGITGTKGKTTTTYMVKSILEEVGIKVGLIGTIEAIIGDKSIPANNTTPESYTIQKYFSEMVEEGCECVVMEVSSQGLKLDRTAGIPFEIGIFTNLGEDHIGPNEHKDFNEYKYGVKMVACSNSASSFGGKVGSGVGGSLTGWMLAAVGYDATLSVAPEATKMAIYGFSFIIPLIAFVVMFVLVSQFDLEKKLPQMREEVAKRKQETVTD